MTADTHDAEATGTDPGTALGLAAAGLLARLGPRGCRIEPGLDPAEFARVEAEFGFEFADDHRAFLAAGLPVSTPVEARPGVIHTYGDPWPDWRDGDPAALRDRLTWPVEGVLFDVEHNRFWHESWGEHPQDAAAALRVARTHLAEVPALVPVYGHRYLPAGRGTRAHPVLSVWQTDIITYGADLPDYIATEFAHPATGSAVPTIPAVPAVPLVAFWRGFIEGP